jgi:mRNA-degrading endonuclease HigB of HigAB toxin-antitoxin module
MSKRANNKDFMTPYELRLYNQIKKSPGDKLKDDKMLESTLKRVMNMDNEVTLESGEVINISTKEMLVMRKIAYDLENPKNIDLKMYANVLGENEIKVNANLKTSAELFGDIAIPNDEVVDIDE